MAFAAIGVGAVTAVTAGVSIYEGDQQKKEVNRQIGNQPKPPNTTQPDESGLVTQGLGRASAANGRGGTVLAPPMGSNQLQPMPSLGLGAPAPNAKTTLGG